jgi:hypothetical protein
MSLDRLKKYILPPVPIAILTLIGLLLLSALLYYKSVRSQRYMEPSLALAQPRIEFAQNMIRLFENEFGPRKLKGVVLTKNSIFISDSLMFNDPLHPKAINRLFLKKMSNIFLSMLKNSEMRPHFDLILINARLRVSPSLEESKKRRLTRQHVAESIMDSMYTVEPNLIKYYGIFAATTVPVQPKDKNSWVEFRIIQSEHLHIELMKSLTKYFLD